MSQLWKCYWDNDVDRFRRLLASAGHSAQNPAKSSAVTSSAASYPNAALGSSPRVATKPRKVSGPGAAFGSSKNAGSALGKAEVNSRDHAGLTILLRAASSASETALAFVEALLEHPAIDIYLQDSESGWNALHRALYHGNISIARLLLGKERRDLTESLGATVAKVGQLIKTKDHEGNSPFDVYNASIALRDLRVQDAARSDGGSESDDGTGLEAPRAHQSRPVGLGEELFTFGSNKNLSLGLGDEDDRHHPERIHLKRPQGLVRQFHEECLQARRQKSMTDSFSVDAEEVPALVQNRPLVIQDVVMSKLHSAVLTTDPTSNLYICGIGRGGRLGLGDENTRFEFTPVLGGLADRKVVQVSLGQNHTLAVSSNGELWTWGSNVYSQLGYALPIPAKPDEEPTSNMPRQLFGPLKKEFIQGVAASSVHSVAHTGSALFTWGKNVGQLALMDADSRSLEVQATPRKVAATLLSSHSSIIMVSAIDKATTCLFEDHTVCVFTSYGYNMIKFPFPDPFGYPTLQRSGLVSMSSRYDPNRRQIQEIVSGGETIAAVTKNGDLFTFGLSNKADPNPSASSTTNPAKIKDAVTQPQCVWNGRNDGVSSVAVGENGSVMISTQSGAVWRRVKRNKVKDARTWGPGDVKRNDFKFQRVPYITGVVAVRSSIFGAHAAVRRDCSVTRDQIDVDPQTLWDDIAPLFPLRGFKAANSRARKNKDTWKFQNPETLKGRVDGLGFEVLTSTDLEQDVASHLQSWSFKNAGLGAVVCTTTAPELRIPVHTWILSARSPSLRMGLQKFRDGGRCEVPETLTISEQDNIMVVQFSGIDLLSLLNIVTFLYGDRVIPAWNFTRQARPLAYRYRQVRTELMKVAAKLGMVKLESAVRIQTSPSRSMDEDFKLATRDPEFFEDGDALLELDGAEISAHSSLLCQRCPWFQGLFNGRSRGMWLATRRAEQDDSARVGIDLKHFSPESFHFVLQHIYTDTGVEIFDEVVACNIDDFSELVMDVMGIANELMLDRLSQICQKVIGRFVNTRNISTLLNLISPCSVTEFKDKGLEYICLQMETMLENHLLDDLDDDLILELDQVVRDNQLARCPFARSGRSDLLLHERHPELAQDIDEERQRRVKAMAFKTSQREDERKLSSSLNKTRFGSLEDSLGMSPTPEKLRSNSKAGRNEPFSPNLGPKDTHTDLIFPMEEESTALGPTPGSHAVQSGFQDELDHLSAPEPWRDSKGKAIEEMSSSPLVPPPRLAGASQSPSGGASSRRISEGSNPWGPTALPTSRLDIGEIMASPQPRKSALAAGLAAEKKASPAKSAPQKMSQKERKKFLQQQTEQSRIHPPPPQAEGSWIKAAAEKKVSPWQKTAEASKASIKDMPHTDPGSALPTNAKPLVAADTSGSSAPRRTASPDTRFSGQARKVSAHTPGSSSRGTPRGAARGAHAEYGRPLMPHSKSYITRAPKESDSTAGLSLADIIAKEQEERDTVREAATAKRSLQEIQQEQAFQEWWDQESRRAQEEEARKAAKGKKEQKAGGGRGGKPKGGGGGGGSSRGGGNGEAGTSSRGRRSTKGAKA